MEHLNYCRQLARHCEESLADPELDPGVREIFISVIGLHGASTKFLLPAGGRLLDDFQFRALDETQPLRLPYPCIALEYQSIRLEDDPRFNDKSRVFAPKRIVFAHEMEDSGQWIFITVAFWTKYGWRVLPNCAIPTVGYLDRTKQINGRVAINFIRRDERVPLLDYSDEIGALLCFLNVLQCSNVHIERSSPKKGEKKVKAALPFDAYHVLTIDAHYQAGSGKATGGHRSPREHLRRGHIRRLADGRRIWVNATVVAAGRGSGVVTKDYAVMGS